MLIVYTLILLWGGGKSCCLNSRKPALLYLFLMYYSMAIPSFFVISFFSFLLYILVCYSSLKFQISLIFNRQLMNKSTQVWQSRHCLFVWLFVICIKQEKITFRSGFRKWPPTLELKYSKQQVNLSVNPLIWSLKNQNDV